MVQIPLPKPKLNASNLKINYYIPNPNKIVALFNIYFMRAKDQNINYKLPNQHKLNKHLQSMFSKQMSITDFWKQVTSLILIFKDLIKFAPK